MAVATFYIQKDGQRDDIFYFSNIPGVENTYSVRYAPNDVNGAYHFTLHHRDLHGYIHDMLNSLSDDVEPFERFQVSSRVSPSIVYELTDLYSEAVRDSIYNTVSLALTSRARFHKNE